MGLVGPDDPGASIAGAAGGSSSDEARVLQAWLAGVCPEAGLAEVDANRFTFRIPRSVGASVATASPFSNDKAAQDAWRGFTMQLVVGITSARP